MEVPTASKWEFLQYLLNRLTDTQQLKPLFDGCYLVGGTALSLKIHHRISCDLDLAWVEGPVLPYRILRQTFLNTIPQTVRGVEVQEVQNLELEAEFIKFGQYAAEHYLSFILSSAELKEEIRVEIWTPDDRAVLNILRNTRHWTKGYLRVASAESIFDIKTLLISRRLTWRDLYDLKVLIENERYPDLDFSRILSVLFRYRGDSAVDSLFLRLRNLKMEHLGGQGFAMLDGQVPDWGTLFQELKSFFLSGLERAFQEDLPCWKEFFQQGLTKRLDHLRGFSRNR